MSASVSDHSRQSGSQLHRFLAGLHNDQDQNRSVVDFVRCDTATPSGAKHADEADPTASSFLTVVTRTQGRRIQPLIELLTCMAGQSDQDFEIVVVGHKLDPVRAAAVRQLIDEQPRHIHERIRLLHVDHGNRTAPLNAGFAAARGSYVTILDDDDTPLGNWVETFRRLADRHPGAMVRAATVKQDVRTTMTLGHSAVRTERSPERMYAVEFDHLQHFCGNQTPTLSIAFPRGLFHDIGLRFDEALTTAEDWDYIMRCAPVAGVVSDPEITSVYRWWTNDTTSRSEHSDAEWRINDASIWQKMDRTPQLLPPGSASRIRALISDRDTCKRECNALRDELRQARAEQADADILRGELRQARIEGAVANALRIRLQRIEAVQQALGSRSWRATAPVRLLGRLLGRKTIRGSDLHRLSDPELEQFAISVRSSTSWRVMEPLRRLSRLLRR